MPHWWGLDRYSICHCETILLVHSRACISSREIWDRYWRVYCVVLHWDRDRISVSAVGEACVRRFHSTGSHMYRLRCWNAPMHHLQDEASHEDTKYLTMGIFLQVSVNSHISEEWLVSDNRIADEVSTSIWGIHRDDVIGSVERRSVLGNPLQE